VALHGEELALIAACDDDAIAWSPKLSRIVQAYCARKACVSYFYRLAFQEFKGVKWEELWEIAAGSGGSSPAVVESPAGPSRSFAQAVVERYGLRKILFASVAMAVALLVLYWRFRTPSWSTAPSQYRVDPASVASPYRICALRRSRKFAGWNFTKMHLRYAASLNATG
jgi:hypothetical protein